MKAPPLRRLVTRLLPALALFLAGCATVGREPSCSCDAARHAYSTGCLEAYRRACARLPTDEARDECRQEGLATCERNADRFDLWLHPGKAGTPRK